MFKLIGFVIKAFLVGLFLLGVLMIFSAIAGAQTPQPASPNVQQFMERMKTLSQHPEPDDLEMMEYELEDADEPPASVPATQLTPTKRPLRQYLLPRVTQEAYRKGCPTKFVLLQSDDHLEMYRSEGRDRNGDLCVFVCYRSSTGCMHLQ